MLRFKFIIILLCIATSAFAQKKYALLVGISNYRIMPIAHEWNNIHGREDVEMLMPVFKAQGFNIATLTDGKATHANIVKALDRLSRTVAKGSIVYIHFSTHGQSFDDALSQRKGDEEWDESEVNPRSWTS
ncbi:MAG: caspase family protein [Bacteroidaceae bacterium]|nr:caspase family protein [Bacteroidaceae bacterium]